MCNAARLLFPLVVEWLFHGHSRYSASGEEVVIVRHRPIRATRLFHAVIAVLILFHRAQHHRILTDVPHTRSGARS